MNWMRVLNVLAVLFLLLLIFLIWHGSDGKTLAFLAAAVCLFFGNLDRIKSLKVSLFGNDPAKYTPIPRELFESRNAETRCTHQELSLACVEW